MAGYSGTPLWKKLGYKTGMEAYVDGGPEQYLALLSLPADMEVRWLARPKPDLKFVHLFATSVAKLKTKLKAYRTKIVPDGGVVWVSWPKKAARVPTDITEDRIREIALPLGFVDIKVCAVDERWSGLKLMIRRTER
jgi:hypothetical protein